MKCDFEQQKCEARFSPGMSKYSCTNQIPSRFCAGKRCEARNDPEDIFQADDGSRRRGIGGGGKGYRRDERTARSEPERKEGDQPVREGPDDRRSRDESRGRR